MCTDGGVTHCSVAWVDDWTVEKNWSSQLSRHVSLRFSKLRVLGMLGQKELALIITKHKRLWKKEKANINGKEDLTFTKQTKSLVQYSIGWRA